MSTPSSPIVDDNAASVVVYASRSIAWSQTTLPANADGSANVFPGGLIVADAVLEERHDDDSIITENPVESGSVTNDHAYDLPRELELTYAWAASSPKANGDPSFLNNMYAQFLSLKQAKILCNIVTGKDATYQNMLIKSLSIMTDKDTENILMVRVAFRQLLLTFTQTISIAPASQQSMANKTSPTVNGGAASLQPAPNYTYGG